MQRFYTVSLVAVNEDETDSSQETWIVSEEKQREIQELLTEILGPSTLSAMLGDGRGLGEEILKKAVIVS